MEMPLRLRTKNSNGSVKGHVNVLEMDEGIEY